MQFAIFLVVLYTFVLGALSAPLVARQEQVSSVVCTSPGTTLDFHSVNVAQLQICGGIAGAITKCQGAPTSTTGASGDALFTITPVAAGATLNISKGRWEQGIRAAAAKCGQSAPFTAVFAGGASTGDVAVELKKA